MRRHPLMKPMAALLTLIVAAACSPEADPRAAAGVWPPKDYAAYSARPPMSVGAELDDEWWMAIEAERWSYRVGVAIVALGRIPPPETGAPAATYLQRTAAGLRNAATRLVALHLLACTPPRIAKDDDCVALAASMPAWIQAAETSTPSKDELQSRLQWFQSNAENFIFPACAVASDRTGDQRYCAAD